ncbi:unnamed protein product [Rhizoctonia solani]|uniref:Secreted protein n=1 Tax=Rhizoctonia solani TaxID=456999 RepID=A0A8H3D5M0_9AGAM|nr:unnamed protein product [Rhizoctonia solani]
MFRSSLARFFAIVYILSSFTVVVWSAPVVVDNSRVVDRGVCTANCNTGNRLHAIPNDVEWKREPEIEPSNNAAARPGSPSRPDLAKGMVDTGAVDAINESAIDVSAKTPAGSAKFRLFFSPIFDE